MILSNWIQEDSYDVDDYPCLSTAIDCEVDPHLMGHLPHRTQLFCALGFVCLSILQVFWGSMIFFDILWYSMIFYGCCRWSNHKNGIHGWRRITVQAFQVQCWCRWMFILPVMCSYRRWPMPDIGLQMTWKSVVYPSRRYRCTFSMIGNQTYIMMSIKHRVQEVTMCCATADLE